MNSNEFDSSFLKVDGLTDAGCKRSVNEDCLGRESTPNGLAVVICDGMGGYVGGEIASQTAVNAVLTHLKEHLYKDPNEAIYNAILEANKAVLKRVKLRPELTGMGCTCVLLLVDRKGTVHVGHVGDSRIYLIRDGLATHLTKDQSYVQMLVDEGTISVSEAEHHPRNNEITNAIGMEKMTPPIIRERPIRPLAGDCFLLCSDGLNKVVPESEMVGIVSERSYDVCTKVKHLIDTAKRNGGPDNITVQLVEFSASPDEVRLTKEKKTFIRYSCLSLAVIALIFVLFFSMRRRKAKENTQTDKSTNLPQEIVQSHERDPNAGRVINEDLLSPLAEDHSTNEKSYENVPMDTTKKLNSKVPLDNVSGQTLGVDENGNENGNKDKSVIDNIGTPKIIRFKNNEGELTVKRPKPGFKYTKNCCHKEGKPYLDAQVTIEEDGKGGLIIKKNLSENNNWDGYKITIDKYCDNKNGPLQASKKIIIIEFE